MDATSSKPNEKPLVKEKPVNAGSQNGVDRKACADGIKLALGSDGADYESKIMKWDTSPVKMDGKFNWLLFMF